MEGCSDYSSCHGGCAWGCVVLGLGCLWLRAQGGYVCYLGRRSPVHAMVVPIMVVIWRLSWRIYVMSWLSGASPRQNDQSPLGHVDIFIFYTSLHDTSGHFQRDEQPSPRSLVAITKTPLRMLSMSTMGFSRSSLQRYVCSHTQRLPHTNSHHHRGRQSHSQEGQSQ